MPSDYTVKYATVNDIPLIAECHLKAFKKTLPARLGKKYIAKMFEWYVVADDRFLFYIAENNKCIGYCGGFVMNAKGKAGSATSMIQYSFEHAVRALVFRPWLWFSSELSDNRKLIIKNIKRKIFRKKN